MSALLGVDLGSKRVGLALATTRVATPLEVIERTGDDKRDAERIATIAREYDASTVVIGYPIRLDGTQGPAAKAVACFADILRTVTDRDVVLHDERLTTKQTERVLIDAGTRRSARKKVVDKLAATVILQSYLDTGRL